MESHDQCSFDYLEVYNGGLATSPVMGKLCGSPSPLPEFLSQSNEVRITMVTDSDSASRGWKLQYSFDAQGNISP